MAERVMFVQLKTGFNTDKGPACISLVRFSKTWVTARWHGKTLPRSSGMFDANFYDVETYEEYWLSGPHRDRGDTRYSHIRPAVDDDVREVYETFLDTGAWPAHLSRTAQPVGTGSSNQVGSGHPIHDDAKCRGGSGQPLGTGR